MHVPRAASIGAGLAAAILGSAAVALMCCPVLAQFAGYAKPTRFSQSAGSAFSQPDWWRCPSPAPSLLPRPDARRDGSRRITVWCSPAGSLLPPAQEPDRSRRSRPAVQDGLLAICAELTGTPPP